MATVKSSKLSAKQILGPVVSGIVTVIGIILLAVGVKLHGYYLNFDYDECDGYEGVYYDEYYCYQRHKAGLPLLIVGAIILVAGLALLAVTITMSIRAAKTKSTPYVLPNYANNPTAGLDGTTQYNEGNKYNPPYGTNVVEV